MNFCLDSASRTSKYTIRRKFFEFLETIIRMKLSNFPNSKIRILFLFSPINHYRVTIYPYISTESNNSTRNFHPRIYPDLIYLNRNIRSKVIRIRLIKLYHEYKLSSPGYYRKQEAYAAKTRDENLGKLVLEPERSSSRFSISIP